MVSVADVSVKKRLIFDQVKQINVFCLHVLSCRIIFGHFLCHWAEKVCTPNSKSNVPCSQETGDEDDGNDDSDDDHHR